MKDFNNDDKNNLIIIFNKDFTYSHLFILLIYLLLITPPQRSPMYEVDDAPLSVQSQSSIQLLQSGRKCERRHELPQPQHRLLTHEQTAIKPAVIVGNCYYYRGNNICSSKLTSTFRLKCCYVKTSQLALPQCDLQDRRDYFATLSHRAFLSTLIAVFIQSCLFYSSKPP